MLFWDLFVADAWQSLNTGRPPSFSLAYIDCQFPQDHERKENAQGEMESGYGSWTFRFATECVAEVAAKTLTADTPSYATIMELDRKVREFPIPEEASAMATSSVSMNDTQLSPSMAITRCVLSHTREVILLYIHRSFFAQAIIDHPVNPLRSPYAASFLAAYRSSATILRTIREHFALQPALCSRFWSMWTFAFSAAIVFGTIVTRGPRSALASNAMSELDQACLLFSKAAVHSRRAAKALSILTKLNEKAHTALTFAQDQQQSPLKMHGSRWNLKQEDSEDELAIFSGRTRIVTSKRGSLSPAPLSAHPIETIPTSYSSTRHGSQGTAVTSSYYSGAPMSSVNDWASEPRRNEYVEPRREQYHPIPQREPSLQYQPTSHYRTQEEVPVSAPVSYQWQQEPCVPPQYYDSQMEQSYTPMTHDNYRQQQLFGPSYQGGHQPLPPPSELADLGLAARDSKLDERWSSFMQDSGLLDGDNFHHHR